MHEENSEIDCVKSNSVMFPALVLPMGHNLQTLGHYAAPYITQRHTRD